MQMYHTSLFLVLFFLYSIQASGQLQTGAEQMEEYLPLLEGKTVGLVVNQTSRVKDQHLVDTLNASGIDIACIFAPEHGFRGTADAGSHIKDQTDTQTGLPVISLYGNNKKPQDKHLKGIDIMIFDIQDVGIRFYTYISTMHHVMEACATHDIPLLILDRPNPNGDYISGPVLDTNYRSFVGMHPIPVVHGLTIGELAQMINGEGWIKDTCKLTIVPVKNYTHKTPYELPVKPSPNLPNHTSIRLYPSLCLMEPTIASIGRGTPYPFQCYGLPYPTEGMEFSFTPESMEGAQYPKHKGVTCYGKDLRQLDSIPPFTLEYIIKAYNNCEKKENFFTSESFFNKLAGNDLLIKQIREQLPAEEIVKSWEEGLNNYQEIRKKYLIYPEHE